MSIISSSSPVIDYMSNLQNLQHYDNDFSNYEKPIHKLMRQNNSYLVQLNTPAKIQRNQSPTVQLKNLKQFQRSLEKERLNDSQLHINTNKKTNSSPKSRIVEKHITSVLFNQQQTFKNDEMEDTAFQYRVRQTQKYGNTNLQKIKNLIVDEKPLKSPKSPRKKKLQLSQYNATSSIDKLHKSYKKTQSDRRQLYVNKYYGDQMRQIKPFKIDNPVSQYLLQKRNQQRGKSKPLYQRSIQLARQLSIARLQKQMEKLQQQQQKYNEEVAKYDQIRKQKYPDSGNKQRQDQFYYELVNKQKIKNQQKQQQKMKNLKQITRQKPFVSKASKQIFNKILQREDLSNNFLKRNQELKAQRQNIKQLQIKKYDQQYCPFAPKICQKSKQLAKKHYQRKQKQQKQQEIKRLIEKQQLKRKFQQFEQKLKQEKILAQKQNSLKFYPRELSTHLLGQKYSGKSKQKVIQKSNAKLNQYKQRNKNNKGKLQKTYLNQEQKIIQKQKQVPIYKRMEYGKKRTNSCYNLSCKKVLT